MLQTLTPSYIHIIEQAAKNYIYKYFITFVKKPYSNEEIDEKIIRKKIKVIVAREDMEFFIFKVINVGDAAHYNTIHYHCVVFANTRAFIPIKKLNKIYKKRDIVIHMKGIYNLYGLLGYIKDKHKILRVDTNNLLLKISIRTASSIIENEILMNFSLIALKIIRGKCYVPI